MELLSSPAYLLQQLINGLTLGSIYALIAIGYTMVYGIVGMINFAHGDIFMIGAFLTFIGFTVMGLLGITWLPLAFFLVLVLAMLLTAMWGWSLERVAYRSLRHSPRLAPLISAIGASIFLQNFVQLSQGASVKPSHIVISGQIELLESHGFIATINTKQLLIMAITIVLMVAFNWIIRHTRLGREQRATEQDRLMASLIGVNVDKIIAFTFVLGAMLAAVAGYVTMIYYGSIDFYIGFIAGIKAFTAAVLGGIGSLPGAVLGGLLLGLIESYWSALIGAEYKDVAAFGILIILLIFRPTGILGRPEVEKV